MGSENMVLECAVCYESYDEGEKCPRMLSCGHTYCSSCMRKLFKDGCIECPQDRNAVVVEEGVHALPKNFSLLDVMHAKSMAKDCDKVTYCDVCDDEKHVAVSFCVDCELYMCHVIAKAHIKMPACKHHSIVPVSAAKKAAPMASALCCEHKEPYRYFDSVCKRAICMDCFALSHTSHECLSLRDAAVVLRQEVVSLCGEARSRVERIKASKKYLSDGHLRLEQRYHESVNKVEDSFEEVSRKLLSRKEELLKQVEQCFKRKSTAFCEQIDKLESSEACLLNSVDRVNHAVQLERDVALVLAYSDMSSTMKMNNTEDTKEVSTIDDFFDFSVDAKTIGDVINSFGSVCDQGCTAEGPGLMYFFPGRDCTFTIRLSDKKLVSSKSDKIPFLVEVQSQEEEQIPVKVFRLHDGSFRVTFSSVNDLFERMVSIRLLDAHISGSPFRVPCFYDKFENVVVAGKSIYKSSMNGWNSWVESARLRGVGLWKIFVHVEVCNADVSGFTVSFQDERTSLQELKTGSQGRGGVVCAKPGFSNGVLECFVDFSSNSCGIAGKVGAWRGFVKLCVFLYHKGNRFWIDF